VAVLAAGFAVPLIHVLVFGAISYLPAQAGTIRAAAVMLGTAILSAARCVLKVWRWLWATGLVALAPLAATIIGSDRTAAAIEMQADPTAGRSRGDVGGCPLAAGAFPVGSGGGGRRIAKDAPAAIRD
jgi:hypothetical protein